VFFVTQLERPNTVAGLEAKKADLVRLRDQLEADLRSVTAIVLPNTQVNRIASLHLFADYFS
jgi:hypothetical protein